MRKTFPRRGTKVLTYSKVARNTLEAVRREVHLRVTPPPQPHLSPSAITLFLTQLLRTLAIFRCGILISYFCTYRKKIRLNGKSNSTSPSLLYTLVRRKENRVLKVPSHQRLAEQWHRAQMRGTLAKQRTAKWYFKIPFVQCIVC